MVSRNHLIVSSCWETGTPQAANDWFRAAMHCNDEHQSLAWTPIKSSLSLTEHFSNCAAGLNACLYVASQHIVVADACLVRNGAVAMADLLEDTVDLCV